MDQIHNWLDMQMHVISLIPTKGDYKQVIYLPIAVLHIQSLDAKNDPFWPLEEDEEILVPEVSYLSAIGALMYLANCTRPDISFAVNLLARYSSTPTKRHWNGVNIYFTISVEQPKWGYFIVDQIHNWLDMQMQVISLIPTKKDHKQVIYLPMAVLQFLGDLSNNH